MEITTLIEAGKWYYTSSPRERRLIQISEVSGNLVIYREGLHGEAVRSAKAQLLYSIQAGFSAMTGLLGKLPPQADARPILEILLHGDRLVWQRGIPDPAHHQMTGIKLHRAEGPSRECTRETFTTWAAADAQLQQWAISAPMTGGYDKVDFTVQWDDGEGYSGRYDLTGWEMTSSLTPASLALHIYQGMTYVAGIAWPSHRNPNDRYSPAEELEAQGWLEVYDLDGWNGPGAGWWPEPRPLTPLEETPEEYARKHPSQAKRIPEMLEFTARGEGWRPVTPDKALQGYPFLVKTENQNIALVDYAEDAALVAAAPELLHLVKIAETVFHVQTDPEAAGYGNTNFEELRRTFQAALHDLASEIDRLRALD